MQSNVQLTRLILGLVGLGLCIPAVAEDWEQVARATKEYSDCLMASAHKPSSQKLTDDAVRIDAVKSDCANERATLSELLSSEQRGKILGTFDERLPIYVSDLAAGKVE